MSNETSSAATLVAKLEAAGLTEHEKLILAIAVAGPGDSGDDVAGFGLGNFAIQGVLHRIETDRMGNFEIQDLMSAFNQAETLSSS